jgi:hypothetical protein
MRRPRTRRHPCRTGLRSGADGAGEARVRGVAVYGYAAIDQARNEMAAAALARVAIEASAVRVVLARLIERTNRQAP